MKMYDEGGSVLARRKKLTGKLSLSFFEYIAAVSLALIIVLVSTIDV